MHRAERIRIVLNQHERTSTSVSVTFGLFLQEKEIVTSSSRRGGGDNNSRTAAKQQQQQ